ncbi:MAG: ABC transporter substrate-binding protein [Nocardiopsaceae bacterium]|jgi:peptide/nickel transport system substrate-binding protein|nr:ABC transporter substrate-binding protein [Nocardiopsaceae bacterium]
MDALRAEDGTISRRAVLRAGAGSAAFASLAGLLAACQGSANGPGGSTGSAGKPTGKPIKKLTVGLPGSLNNLYPGQESGILNYYVAALVMEGLVYVDPKGITRPAIASSWKRPDAKTYVYTLRPDAKFSDGTPVTVDDVIYSFEMARSAKSSPSIASYYGALKTVTQTGTNEITAKLSTPSESFEWIPSSPGALFIAPKAFWQKNNGQIGTPDALIEGTGPSRVTSFEPDSHVRMEVVDTWWGGKPKVNTIQINFISNDSARFLAEKSGAIQMSFNVPLDAMQQWQTLPGNRVLSVPDRSWAGIIFNVGVAPTNDIHVRRAIAHCIDRAAVVKELLHGEGQVATAMSTPEQFAGVYTPQEATAKLAAIPQLEFSIAQAKAELAKSSVPHGFTTTLEYPNTGPQLGTAALSLASNLKQIGVTLQVKEVTISQWLANLSAPKQPLRYMWYFNTTPDPAELVTYLLNNPPKNLAGYVNKQVDTLLAQAMVELDAAKRASLIIEAQKVAAADLPYLSLWWGRSLTSFSDHVGVKNFSSYIFESPWASNLYSSA